MLCTRYLSAMRYIILLLLLYSALSIQGQNLKMEYRDDIRGFDFFYGYFESGRYSIQTLQCPLTNYLSAERRVSDTAVRSRTSFYDFPKHEKVLITHELTGVNSIHANTNFGSVIVGYDGCYSSVAKFTSHYLNPVQWTPNMSQLNQLTVPALLSRNKDTSSSIKSLRPYLASITYQDSISLVAHLLDEQLLGETLYTNRSLGEAAVKNSRVHYRITDNVDGLHGPAEPYILSLDSGVVVKTSINQSSFLLYKDWFALESLSYRFHPFSFQASSTIYLPQNPEASCFKRFYFKDLNVGYIDVDPVSDNHIYFARYGDLYVIGEGASVLDMTSTSRYMPDWLFYDLEIVSPDTLRLMAIAPGKVLTHIDIDRATLGSSSGWMPYCATIEAHGDTCFAQQRGVYRDSVIALQDYDASVLDSLGEQQYGEVTYPVYDSTIIEATTTGCRGDSIAVHLNQISGSLPILEGHLTPGPSGQAAEYLRFVPQTYLDLKLPPQAWAIDSLTLSYTELGCLKKVSFPLVVDDPPLYDYSAPTTLACDSTAYDVEVLTLNDNTRILWLDDANAPPARRLAADAAYLAILSSGACADSLAFQLEAGEACEEIIAPAPPPVLPQLPSAFSPNGDGLHDLLALPYQLDSAWQLTQLQIFDRWGNVHAHLEASSDQSVAWDGRISRTKRASSDHGRNSGGPIVYVYLATARHRRTNQEVQLKGDVSLMDKK